MERLQKACHDICSFYHGVLLPGAYPWPAVEGKELPSVSGPIPPLWSKLVRIRIPNIFPLMHDAGPVNDEGVLLHKTGRFAIASSAFGQHRIFGTMLHIYGDRRMVESAFGMLPTESCGPTFMDAVFQILQILQLRIRCNAPSSDLTSSSKRFQSSGFLPIFHVLENGRAAIVSRPAIRSFSSSSCIQCLSSVSSASSCKRTVLVSLLS